MQTDGTLLFVPQQGIHLDPRLNTGDEQMISADIILQGHFQVIEHKKPLQLIRLTEVFFGSRMQSRGRIKGSVIPYPVAFTYL